MDADRFDHLVRTLFPRSSRRGLLTRLTSGLLVLLPPVLISEDGEAKKKGGRKKKRKKRAACGAGLTRCGTECANLQTNRNHCGDCATQCQGDLVCSGGECTCPSGTRCGNQCVNTQTNPNHCGGCDSPCPQQSPATCGRTGACVGGACEKHGTDTVCRPASCNGLTLRLAATCDGNGNCPQSSEVSCDDGVACTADTCDAGSGSCAHTPDDNLCPGNEVCDPEQGCQECPNPCGILCCSALQTCALLPTPACVTGIGTCAAGSNACGQVGTISCTSRAGVSQSCLCLESAGGETRCANSALLGGGCSEPNCDSDAVCQARFPAVPGAFCAKGGGCCDRNFCAAPCPDA